MSNGRYKVGERISRGAQGCVYEVESTQKQNGSKVSMIGKFSQSQVDMENEISALRDLNKKR